MARSRPRSEAPQLWAIPVSGDAVALWVDLAASAAEVGISPESGAADVLFKRRLISRGRRLHLFVLRIANSRGSDRFTVTYRAERGQASKRFEASPKLADWRTASMGAVVHAVVEGLEHEQARADTRQLVRFLSMASSWATPCRYQGSDGRLRVAVYEFSPKSTDPITAVMVADGVVTTHRLLPVPLDAQSCCLIWEGEAFDQAYIELEGELLELKLEPPSAAAKSLVSWFGALSLGQQDVVLDGLAQSALEGIASSFESLGRQLPHSRDFVAGAWQATVSAVFGLASGLCVIVDDPGDRVRSLRLSALQAPDRAIDARRVALGSGDPGRSLVFLASEAFDFDLADGSPVRVTIACADPTTSHWLPVQGMADPQARRRISRLIDWDGAGEDLVRDVAVAVASVDAVAHGSGPTEFVLSEGQPPADAALFICRYRGDILRLRSTLIALRLTADDEATVRLVCHGRPTSAEILDLRALSLALGLAVTLVMLHGDAPYSDALRLGSGDGRRRTILLADSGMAPLDCDWWQRLAAVFDHDPSLLCYGLPEGRSDIGTSALTYLSGPSPLVVAGPRLAAGVLIPDFDLQTFEGTIHHALAKAGRMGVVERLGCLRTLADAGPLTETSLGAARLDDAVVAAALAAKAPGVEVQKSNLVHLPARAGG